jgi:CHAD domain-containing protein
MENARMLTPKDPKPNSRKSSEGFSESAVVPPEPRRPQKSAPIALRVGDYAHGLIQRHFQRMLGERTAVVDDSAPEALHQMRVHGRRLRATIGLFGLALKIPKQGHLKSLQRFHRTLGTLRNLDVVIAQLQPGDSPQLPESEQQVLDRCLKKLAKQRRRALEDVQVAIAAQTFEVAYVDWLKHPQYRQFAAQTLTHVLPQLLLPDLTVFLAHPGWAIAAADATVADPAVLHDLRKRCKHQRDQLEAVSQIYGAAVETWIVGLKAIQDCLGTLQDLAVLAEMGATRI